MLVTELCHAASYRAKLAHLLAAMRRVAILHSSILHYTCATGHLGVGLVGAQSVTVRAVTPDYSEEHRSITSCPRTTPRRWWTFCVKPLGYNHFLTSTITRAGEPVRFDIERREPRCRICRHESVRIQVNKLLDWHGVPVFLEDGKTHRTTYADILRVLEPLNEGRDKRDRITYDSLVGSRQASLRDCRGGGLLEHPDTQGAEECPAGITGRRTSRTAAEKVP